MAMAMVPLTILKNSPLSERDIEEILTSTGLKFSPENIWSVFCVVKQYPVNKYLLEEQKIKKADQLKKLEDAVAAAERVRSCVENLNLYSMLDPFLMHRAKEIASKMKDAADKEIERTRNNPIKKGRKILPARLILISSLIAIFENETKKKLIESMGEVGRGKIKETYTRYDPQAFDFIFRILCAVEPNFNKNRLQKDIANILEKADSSSVK